ncbi:MAG: PAS domain S-box protein [Sulfurifustis sp.]
MRTQPELKLVRSHAGEAAPEGLAAAIIDSADDAIISRNLQGVIQTWNRGAERLFGYRAEEAIGKPITLLIPPERRNEEPEILARITRGERIEHYETVRVAKDGRPIPISLSVSPIRDARGEIVGASKIARDLTPQKEAERVQAHFAAIVESANDAIISKNLQGVIQTWNPGAERVFGYRAEEVIGKSITLLIPPERQNEEPEILARIANGERIEHYETVRVRKDGRRIPISLTISPIRNARGEIIGASKIARDMTERIGAENALREAERRKDEFLAMLAHELRNPLTPIRTGLDIIQKNLGDQKRRQWALEVIDRQLVQLGRVIDDLLELARIVNGNISLKRDIASVRALVSNAVESSRPFIHSRRHHLRVDLPERDLSVYVDPVRMGQALTNLLINAAKYTPPGGTITIQALKEDEALIIRVTDTGRGIEEELLPKVFDPFVQGKPDYARTEGGLGVGLSIVRRIVELHDGTVSAHSNGRDAGSEFSIKLPLCDDIAAEAARAGEEVHSLTSRRVLIVDDNHDVADVIAAYFNLNGHEVAQHYTGDGVIEKALAFRPDAIVLDLGLPGRDGFEVAEELRAHPDFHRIPIIAISGYDQSNDIERSRTAGINFHMVKPVDSQLLVKLIEANVAPGAAR